MKLLRTIRLDASDTFVFDASAEPGEWAISGTFVFWCKDPSQLEGKARTAFRSGFLGVSSLGWSTLVQIVKATHADRAELVRLLAKQLMQHFGAPGIAAATAAAEDEVTFVESLCTEPRDSIVAVHRGYENGEVRETFRTLRHRERAKPARAFSISEVEDEDDSGEELDLAAIAERKQE